jgi:sugar/nucleoside kinase (ribokinase family)
LNQPRFDVVAIGNALVDVLAHADDAFLASHGLSKGTMTLIDAEQGRRLYEEMPPAVEMSGGSAANAMAAVASLGGRASYIGRVSRDQFGDLFRHDIRTAGVSFDTPAASDNATGRCLILVTPDAQRTMHTFLGAAADLGPDDVDEQTIAASSVTFLEGYLFDPPPAKQAFVKAARAAHAAGRTVALTLSDPFCVERHREEFVDLVEHHVDLLFANEAEVMALYETSFDEGLERIRARCRIAALTRGANGSVVVGSDDVHTIVAERVGPVVDTTGAGDAYAAGFLVGLTSGRELAICGRMGSIAAAEAISHVGARPELSLRELVAARLGS